MPEITIKIKIPDEFNNSDDLESIDEICYRNTLIIVGELQLQSLIKNDENSIDPTCDVIYTDSNGEYDTPAQVHEIHIS